MGVITSSYNHVETSFKLLFVQDYSVVAFYFIFFHLSINVSPVTSEVSCFLSVSGNCTCCNSYRMCECYIVTTLNTAVPVELRLNECS